MQWLKYVFQIWTKVNDFCANISQKSLVLFWSIKPLGPQWKRNSWKMVKMKQRNNLSECCISIRKMLFSISKNIESNIFIYKKYTFPSPDFSCGGTFHTKNAGRGDKTLPALAGIRGEVERSRFATEVHQWDHWGGAAARRGGANLGVEWTRWIMAIWGFPRGFASHLTWLGTKVLWCF